MWAAFYDDPLPWSEPAERLGLADHLDQRFGTLSGGQQQRLSIALALVGRPRVAILDELSTGLDPRARREVWSLVRDLRDTRHHRPARHPRHGGGRGAVRPGRHHRRRKRARHRHPGRADRRRRGGDRDLVRAVRPVDLVALRELEGVADVRADAGRVIVTGGRGRGGRRARPRSRARASHPTASGSSTARSTRPTWTSTLNQHGAPRVPRRRQHEHRQPHRRRHPDRVAALHPRARLAVLDRALPHDPGRDPGIGARA